MSVIVLYCTDGLAGVDLSFMYPISKDPRLWGLFQYTKEVVIEFGHWTRYVAYISVIVFNCANGLSGVILSFMHPVSKDPQLWKLFQYTKEVVIEFGYWTRYVVYVSVIVCYSTGGLSGVILSFVYSISKDPCKSVKTLSVHQRSCDWVSSLGMVCTCACSLRQCNCLLLYRWFIWCCPTFHVPYF